jgi:predicted acetyltransferase
VVPGSMGQKDIETFDEFLTRQENSSKWINISSKRVPATLYFLIDTETKRLLGWIHIRHHLNEELQLISWHIWYGIRPSERKKWYATLALSLALPKARELGLKEVMLTCSKTNIWSAKTIQNNW